MSLVKFRHTKMHSSQNELCHCVEKQHMGNAIWRNYTKVGGDPRFKCTHTVGCMMAFCHFSGTMAAESDNCKRVIIGDGFSCGGYIDKHGEQPFLVPYPQLLPVPITTLFYNNKWS